MDAVATWHVEFTDYTRGLQRGKQLQAIVNSVSGEIRPLMQKGCLTTKRFYDYIKFEEKDLKRKGFSNEKERPSSKIYWVAD